MLTDSFIDELRNIVGESQVSVSRAGTELYAYDASLARGQRGVLFSRPTPVTHRGSSVRPRGKSSAPSML